MITGLAIGGALLAFALCAQMFFKSFSFTAWVLFAVSLALCFPATFQTWSGVSLSKLVVPIIQIIMFGMGTTLSVREFGRIGKAPWPVAVGIFLQFAIMPVAGYLLARLFDLGPELAAGVILIGACSGGLASNIMTYLSGANVALSMAMTLVSTVIAPVATPLTMLWLAGQYLPIDAWAMTLGVFDVMIVPVAFGMFANTVLYSPSPRFRRSAFLSALALTCFATSAFLVWANSSHREFLPPLRASLIIAPALLALVATIRRAALLGWKIDAHWMDRVLPVASTIGICAILAIITAQTHAVLLRVGGTIFIVAILHNLTGFVLGYWGARGTGALLGRFGHRRGWFATPSSVMDERDCRTVAFEVGMQNGGMATALAVNVLHSQVAALPPNLFGTWQNVAGSLLANYWKRRRCPDAAAYTAPRSKSSPPPATDAAASA